MKPTSFDRFAGLSAILAGVGGILYGIAFVILRNQLLSSLLLMLGGLLATVVLVALYSRLRETDMALALWALLVGVVGALGAVVHGGYNLANAIHPPAAGGLSLPNAADPRGLVTFGFAGIALFAFAWLIRHGGQFPKGLGNLGYVLAILLVVIYLGRLIIRDPTNPVVGVALLAGVVANTVWYIWLGLVLRRGPSA